uniref:Uncharacterized protein n=1 Tax=Canis lupus dingo TaxID=286419 RepID=A0A8C0L0N8_CANLU
PLRLCGLLTPCRPLPTLSSYSHIVSACPQCLWPPPSLLVVLRAKCMIHVADFSTRQGGGIECSSSQSFCHLYMFPNATLSCSLLGPRLCLPLN